MTEQIINPEPQVEIDPIKAAEFFTQQAKEYIKNGRLQFYAESLKVPSKDLEEWYTLPIPGIEKPHAHKWQRMMTYPWEGDLERFKKAIYYLYFAGNQGGKSVWSTAWVIMECLGIHPLQELGVRPKPPVHWWVVSTELPSDSTISGGMDAPVVKTFYEWCPNEKIKFYRKDKIMTINDSVIGFKSFDQQKIKFKGERLDGIDWDEEPPKSLWEEGIPRIIKKNGIFLLAMTADYGSWTWQLLKNRNEPEYAICEMDSLENPFMPEEHRKRVLATLSEEQLLMRRFGKHIQFKGKVFPFQFEIHVRKDPFLVTNDCANYVIVDWHAAKPTYITYLSINPENIWYTFDESVVEDKSAYSIVQEIRHKLTKLNYNLRVRKYIIDRNAQIQQIQEQPTKRSKSIVDMLREYGIRCEIGNPSFESAHSFLCDKMKHREWYVNPECKSHIDQFDTWGAKRYQKGNLEGTLRDQLELEGNDTCINHVYAYNSGAKFSRWTDEEIEMPWTPPRPSTSRIYGRLMV